MHIIGRNIKFSAFGFITAALAGMELFICFTNLSLPAAHDPQIISNEWHKNLKKPSIDSGVSSSSPKNSKTQAAHKKRELLLPEAHLGVTNQMSCLSLAAVYAIQYNRTLVVPGNGVAKNILHKLFPIKFKRVYDYEYARARLDFRIDTFGSQSGHLQKKHKSFQRKIPKNCNTTLRVDPRRLRDVTLAKDPFEDEDCWTLFCYDAYLRFNAPPDLFRQNVDQVIFRYNQVYHDAAAEVISAIEKKVKTKGNRPFRLLTLHIRRGDRRMPPLFNCSDLGGMYPYLNIRRKFFHDTAIACSSNTTRGGEGWPNIFTWEKFFKHMSDPHCALPICASDFDAIFAATNDPAWARQEIKKHALPALFFISDFPSIYKKYVLPATLKSDMIEEATEMLLIEEMVMVQSYRHVPGLDSTITHQVMRLRVDYRPNDSWDKHLLDTYYYFREQAYLKWHPRNLTHPILPPAYRPEKGWFA